MRRRQRPYLIVLLQRLSGPLGRKVEPHTLDPWAKVLRQRDGLALRIHEAKPAQKRVGVLELLGRGQPVVLGGGGLECAAEGRHRAGGRGAGRLVLVEVEGDAALHALAPRRRQGRVCAQVQAGWGGGQRGRREGG